MKKVVMLLMVIFCIASVGAQNPVEYMQKINHNNEEIMQNNWRYLSAVARSKSPSKVANMRQQLEASLKSSLRNLNAVGSFNGNDDYRQASINYQKFSLDLITGKTAKLVDLEKISQNSYDNMEAFILYQRELSKLSTIEAEKINQAQEKFANANQINLVSEESELMQKIEEGSKVLHYQEDMLLVYMRSSMYELDMLSRINTDNDYNFTQAGITLLDLVEQSRAALDTIKDINNDKSLRNITAKALDMFEDEAETLIPVLAEFNKSKNEFESYQKKIEDTPAQSRTKAMTDEYNQKAESLNALSTKFTQLLNTYNQKRVDIFNEWNKVSDNFINKYMPAE